MTRELRSVWRPARVVENRPVAQGSMWLALDADDGLPAAYQPGHVLSIALNHDGGYLRHAYTVSRGEPRRARFEHLYRVIPEGRMTPLLAELRPGAELFFHGPFHTPIQQEIRSDAERIVLMATGTGVGPIFGYAEKALNEGETRPMALYAGFREQAHFCLTGELDALARQHPNFSWHFTVTRPEPTWRGLTGRITECVPPLLQKGTLERLHFHLVGNGKMVHLVRAALCRAGIPPERVSIETYFNHHAEPADAEIDALAARFRRSRIGGIGGGAEVELAP